MHYAPSRQQPDNPCRPEAGSDIEARPAKEKIEHEQGTGENAISAVPVIIIQKYEDAIRTERRENDAECREKRDLVAQQVAASAAESAAIFAYFQTWIAFGATIVAAIGTGLVWRTLKEAKETTRLALDGSKSARDAVDEARHANRIAADSAERQLRAYVMVTNVKVHRYDDNNGFYAEVCIKNHGATPADNIAHDFKVFSNPESFLPNFTNAFCMGPGQELIVKVSYGGTANFLRLSMGINQKESVFLIGIITYRDCFGFKRTTSVKYVLRNRDLISTEGANIREIVAATAEDGNSYT